jgi:hypothetical protein
MRRLSEAEYCQYLLQLVPNFAEIDICLLVRGRLIRSG